MDDNADMRAYLRRLLQPAYDVRLAADGADALTQALAAPPDLVLSDVMMPRLDGFGLLRALRADPRTHTVPIILLSARAGEDARLEGLTAGADDYLIKPFSAQELVARIRSALQLAKVRREATQALRESEDRLRFALEASRTGAWDLDLDDHTVHRSLEHDRLFGYESLLPAWTYEMFLEHVVPEDRTMVDATFRQAVETGSDWSFECRIRRRDGEIRWIWAAGRHRGDPGSGRDRIAGISQDITERKQAEQQREFLIHELNHRVKNTLSIVQALAMQTARSASTPEAFTAAFTNRLLALARTHDLLTMRRWADVGIHEVVGTIVAAYGGMDRIAARGDRILLSPKAALALSLALHELATNATKYGGLIRPEGRVMVAWSKCEMNGSAKVELEWREEGGPPVVRPKHKGFGLRLLERGLRLELGGAVTVEFPPTGVRCSLRLPLSSCEGA